MAVACGLAAATIYVAQPLLDLLASDFHVSRGTATLLITASQLGYAVGILLVVPLGDLLENRRLVVTLLLAGAGALLLALASWSFAVFAIASLTIGVTASVAQLLIPFAANLAPDERRGRVVGRVMSGLLLGILLARTVASWVAEAAGWRTVYAVAAAATIVTALVLRRMLPHRQPAATERYGVLLHSMIALAREEPILRRRALVQMLFFGAFSAFWTTVAYELIEEHGLTHAGVGLFALVGAAGAGAAPVAGRLADRGLGRPARGAMAALGIVALGLAGVGDASVVRLAAAGFLLDVAVQGHQVLSQRDVYSLRPDARSRANTIYMTVIFAGGALLTAAAGVLYEAAGWTAVSGFAASLLGLALLVWLVVPEPDGGPAPDQVAGGRRARKRSHAARASQA